MTENGYCLSRRAQWIWWITCVVAVDSLFLWQMIRGHYPDLQMFDVLAIFAAPFAFKWALFGRCDCKKCEEARQGCVR
jgi:hypothetical protein